MTTQSTSLIAIKEAIINNEVVHTVNAKELWKFLEVQTRFNDWIARQIEEYGFFEGNDFYSNLSKSTGGRQAKNYTLTLDMAKELAMVERNEKGKQARRYFIECERKLKEARQQRVIELETRVKQIEHKPKSIVNPALQRPSRREATIEAIEEYQNLSAYDRMWRHGGVYVVCKACGNEYETAPWHPFKGCCKHCIDLTATQLTGVEIC